MSTEFTVEISQNEYLAEGAEDVNAIVTVTSPATGVAAPMDDQGSAEIIIIDCSGSMRSPRTKIEQARAATAAAVDVIRDGVAFAVIAGTNTAQPIFPLDYSLTIADDQTRFLAKQAVAGSLPRGVGTDWQVGELRRISSALLGTVDIVPDPSGLAADFAAMMQTAMGKQVADVSLRVWTPQHATFRFLKQVAPTVEDLTGRRVQSAPQAGDYPTGAWGASESRDYHLCVRVTPAGVGQEMLAARVSLVAATPSGPDVLGQGLVRAIWTDDEALSTRINGSVAHYTGQAELAQVIQESLEARKQGDEDTATAKLGRAVALAEQSGNEGTAKLLAKVVDVVDAASGTVQLKKRVDDADEMALDTRSTKTVRTKK